MNPIAKNSPARSTPLFYKFYLGHHSWPSSQGFTLIELLVVVIVIAILAAIALPSMLNHANRAKESEARSNIGAVNRAQQAYRLQNAEFAATLADLALAINTSSEGYTYSITVATAQVGEYQAQPLTADLRAFTGCAFANTGAMQAVTRTDILEAPAGGGGIASPPDCP